MRKNEIVQVEVGLSTYWGEFCRLRVDVEREAVGGRVMGYPDA